MNFSPWAILAIVLTGVALAGILVIHRWRTRVDKRRQAAIANEKTAAAAGHSDHDGSHHAHPLPPSDLGESGEGPGPGPGPGPGSGPGSGAAQQTDERLQQQWGGGPRG